MQFKMMHLKMQGKAKRVIGWFYKSKDILLYDLTAS